MSLLLASCGISIQGGSSHYTGLEAPVGSINKVDTIVGVAIVRDDNVYSYAGLKYNIKDNIEVSAAAGYYDVESLLLGGELEFRTSVEYAITPLVGVGYVHISNAGFGDINPGFDAFFITFKL